jgi:hypothetical protein
LSTVRSCGRRVDRHPPGDGLAAPDRLNRRPWHFIVAGKALLEKPTDLLGLHRYLETVPVFSTATENLLIAATVRKG